MNKEELYKEIETHYRKNHKRLIKMISNLVGNSHNAEDVVQNTYVKALEYWKSFEPNSNLDAWIRRIFTNCIKDKINDERHHGMKDDSLDEVVYPKIVDKKLLEKLYIFIEEQSEPVKKILKLHFFEEYSSKDISIVVPEGYDNIRKIIQRFRDQVKVMYK